MQPWLEHGLKIAEAAGFDVRSNPDFVKEIIVQAIKEASFEHARMTGDIYNPYDKELYYPQSEEKLQSFVISACSNASIASQDKTERPNPPTVS